MLAHSHGHLLFVAVLVFTLFFIVLKIDRLSSSSYLLNKASPVGIANETLGVSGHEYSQTILQILHMTSFKRYSLSTHLGGQTGKIAFHLRHHIADSSSTGSMELIQM